MSIDLDREIGSHKNLLGLSVEKMLNNQMRLLITHYLSSLVEKKINKCYWDEDTTTFVKYLNYKELETIIMGPQKKEDKLPIPLYYEPNAPVYGDDEVTYDKAGKEKLVKGKRLKDKNGKLMTAPNHVEKKEYCKIGTHIRKAMAFMIAQFYDTLHQFYTSKDGDFPDSTEFHECFAKFAYDKKDINSTHAIISLFTMDSKTDMFLDLASVINKILFPIYAKNASAPEDVDDIVNDILDVTIEYIESFVKIMCSIIANGIFEKRKSVDISSVYGALRIINLMFVMNRIDAEFPEETFELIEQYINWKKPAAKKESISVESEVNKEDLKDKMNTIEGSFSSYNYDDDFDYDDTESDE